MPAVIVPDVNVAPRTVHGNIIVPVAENAAIPRINVEAISPTRVRDYRTVLAVAEVIDPRCGGVWPSDDELCAVL